MRARTVARTAVLALGSIAASVPFAASAASPFQDAKEEVGKAQEKAEVVDVQIEVLVGKYIQIALSILGVLFLAYVVYGGYLWMTAQGNEDQVEKAKRVITHGIIGLAIVVAAYAIAAFVVGSIESKTGIFTGSSP